DVQKWRKEAESSRAEADKFREEREKTRKETEEKIRLLTEQHREECRKEKKRAMVSSEENVKVHSLRHVGGLLR
ncbi:hypothetical protein AVEN_271598-1, partial [Araneus ventricosus]